MAKAGGNYLLSQDSVSEGSVENFNKNEQKKEKPEEKFDTYELIHKNKLKTSRVEEKQNLSITESRALSLVVSETIKTNGPKCFLKPNKKAFTNALIESLKDQKAEITNQNQVKMLDNIIAHAETDGLKMLHHYWYVTRALLNNYGNVDQNVATKYIRNFPELPIINTTEIYYNQLKDKQDFAKEIKKPEDFVKKIEEEKKKDRLFIGSKKEHKNLIAKIATGIHEVVKKEEKQIKYKDDNWLQKAKLNSQYFAEYAALNEIYKKKAIEWGKQKFSSKEHGGETHKPEERKGVSAPKSYIAGPHENFAERTSSRLEIKGRKY
jgi:hypothetical protein